MSARGKGINATQPLGLLLAACRPSVILLALLTAGVYIYLEEVIFSNTVTPLDVPPPSTNTENERLGLSAFESAGPRVAICLAGGIRHFELTGPSIKKYLVSTYENTDVFIVAPKDQDSWKLHLLQGTRVVAVRVFQQEEVPESEVTDAVIHQSLGSPNGPQGLLQYLALVEACNELIERYEAQHKVEYEWILRTRPDAVWSAPPPLLETLNSSEYYIPGGSDWWGVNDRLGLGNREHSRAALAWLSSLPAHRRKGHNQLTSEEKFQRLLEMEGILPLVRRHVAFPFCVLTRRTFRYPPKKKHGGPVAPLGSPSALNGAYCRPCAAEADAAVLAQIPMADFNMTDFCNVSADWAPGWEDLFDAAVGRDLAQQRQKFEEERNFFTCVKKLAKFLKEVEVWEGGFSTQGLCALAFPTNENRQKSQHTRGGGRS